MVYGVFSIVFAQLLDSVAWFCHTDLKMVMEPSR